MKFLGILLILLTATSLEAKERYELVYIESLTEQEIGKYIIRDIYSRLNLKTRIVGMPGSRANHALKTGFADGEAMRTYSYGEANPSFIRIPTPIYKIETMAFIRKDKNIEISGPNDLKYYTVARARGVQHTAEVSKNVENVVELTSSRDIIKFVDKGRADVGLISRVEGLNTIQQQRNKNIAPINNPLASSNLYHYVHQDHKNLVAELDAMVVALTESGELAQLILEAETAVLSQSK